MPKYAHADVLGGGLNALKNGADQMWLLKGYVAKDSFATASGNKIASVAMDNTDPTTDYSIAGADGAALVLTIAAKSGTASGSSTVGDDLHVALVDTVNSKVLYVTDETTNQPITSGNPVNFPSLTYISGQPA
ncbi:hypothetical protein SAMN05216428_11295 [Nitrosospira sp. Nsp11]|uniref:hypothetical protein n=1 Tax=Nitrosospira sp. Nsp11 TaxID=1855338 RepID=UPI000916CCDC|nr:hypothetical protein [Nitrosospira sp. Nsp11]SHM05635.1 hypothetical protein SAMN05216428_11295 [Nitrosospira sp. Nsp11]